MRAEETPLKGRNLMELSHDKVPWWVCSVDLCVCDYRIYIKKNPSSCRRQHCFPSPGGSHLTPDFPLSLGWLLHVYLTHQAYLQGCQCFYRIHKTDYIKVISNIFPRALDCRSDLLCSMGGWTLSCQNWTPFDLCMFSGQIYTLQNSRGVNLEFELFHWEDEGVSEGRKWYLQPPFPHRRVQCLSTIEMLRFNKFLWSLCYLPTCPGTLFLECGCYT